MAEALSYAGSRLVLTHKTLVPEYPASAITMRDNWKAPPADPELLPHLATKFESWRLPVTGGVLHPTSFSLVDLAQLPRKTQIVARHCINGYTSISPYTGVPLRDLLASVGLAANVRYIGFEHCRPWAFLGMLALAWWCYAAPIQLAKRIRTAVEESGESGASSLIASRVDFVRVNAQLSGDLHGATHGHLTGESFAHLLLYGWLPQQRKKPDASGSVPDRAQHTRLYRIRYQNLNRFIAIYWDPGQIHEVVLTLQRKSVLHRWSVTRVHQFSVCAYDFDCALISEAN